MEAGAGIGLSRCNIRTGRACSALAQNLHLKRPRSNLPSELDGMTRRHLELPKPLPEPSLDGRVSLERTLAGRRSVRRYGPDALTLAEAGQLLWAAQGVTHRDGKRTSPSAGALHPLEAYLVADRVADLEPGVYGYQPLGHRLSEVSSGRVLSDLAASAWGQDWIAGAAAAIALSAVYARTSERYGERGQRYVHMEAGHAAQNVLLQATALDLSAVVVGAFDDVEIARLLGGDPAEHPLCLLPVGRRS
jgi:SagB-type dehydrogenase family enzyme